MERMKKMSDKNMVYENERQELLRKIEEYEQLISDAEGALDAAIMDLEELLAEYAEE